MKPRAFIAGQKKSFRDDSSQKKKAATKVAALF
jgi:hypothetical protein